MVVGGVGRCQRPDRAIRTDVQPSELCTVDGVALGIALPPLPVETKESLTASRLTWLDEFFSLRPPTIRLPVRSRAPVGSDTEPPSPPRPRPRMLGPHPEAEVVQAPLLPLAAIEGLDAHVAPVWSAASSRTASACRSHMVPSGPRASRPTAHGWLFRLRKPSCHSPSTHRRITPVPQSPVHSGNRLATRPRPEVPTIGREELDPHLGRFLRRTRHHSGSSRRHSSPSRRATAHCCGCCGSGHVAQMVPPRLYRSEPSKSVVGAGCSVHRSPS